MNGAFRSVAQCSCCVAFHSWIFKKKADLKMSELRCEHCDYPFDESPSDMLVFDDNCLVHRGCFDEFPSEYCPCGGAEADADLATRKLFCCAGCKKHSLKMICRVSHGGADGW